MTRSTRTIQQAAQQVDQAADQLLGWLQQQGQAHLHDPHGAPETSVHFSTRASHADGAGMGASERDQAAPNPVQGCIPSEGGVSLHIAHTDWLHHRLDVSGPTAMLVDFQAAASGAGIIPWPLDRERIAEDVFHLLVAPPAPQRRRLSLAGARVLAGQLCDSAELRHAAALARVGHSRACAFDLHALVPVPPAILLLGPDHADSVAWLWAHWGTTAALRHVTIEPALVLRTPLPADTARLRLSFWSADWTPWRALAVVTTQWPALHFAVTPTYGLL